MLSFKDGLQSLPRALAARLADRYHPRTSVETVSPLEGGGFTVRARRDGDPVAWTARHVVVAADGAPAADWVRAMDSGLAALLESFPYNRLIVISLGIERASATLPAGFGFLVPRGEELRILGAIVPSNFLPGRAPDGCAALSVFIGGELDDTAFDLADDEIEGVLCRNLRRAIGWDGRARAIHIERWPRAIPQYDLRHAARLRQIAQAEARWPGLHLAGNWRGGVGVPDRVEFARRLSETIAGSLRASDAAIPERTAHATAFARGAA
jgi:oxygen-dependent protoporphyrinogen oxidase